MGVCGSRYHNFVPNTEFPGQDQQVYEIMKDTLHLQDHEINKLFHYYCLIDKDLSGEIDMSEMFSYFRLEDNILHRKLFSYFDEDGSGYLNFAEFTCTLWNFLTSKSLGLIFFNMADIIGKGTLTNDELKALMEQVHNITDLEQNKLMWTEFVNVRKGVEIFNFIKVDEIIDFIAANPSLAGPIFIIQTNLRQNVMNTNFWIDQAGARSSDPNLNSSTFPKELRHNVRSINDAADQRARNIRSKKILSKKDKKMEGALLAYNGEQALEEYKMRESKREESVEIAKNNREKREQRRLRMERLDQEEADADTEAIMMERKEKRATMLQSTVDKRGARMSGRRKSIVDTMKDMFTTPKEPKSPSSDSPNGRSTRRKSIVDSMKDIGSFVKKKVKSNGTKKVIELDDGSPSEKPKRRKSVVESLKDMGDYVKKKAKGNSKKKSKKDTVAVAASEY